MIKKIGVVAVDSGLLMVGDPCYFWPRSKNAPICPATERYEDWASIVDDLFEIEREGKQLDFVHGGAGLAVAVPTLIGDGVYPVFLETTPDGKRRLIVEI